MPTSNGKLKRLVIKEELVELTGSFIQALMLNQFLYWSERRIDFDKFIQEELDRDDGAKMELTKGWIYKKAEELNDELMIDMSVSTIRRHLSKLVKSGYLKQRCNPNFAWDKTLQYRPDIKLIQQDLQKLGYSLEGYPLCNGKNGASNFQNENSKLQNENSKLQNETAIPETTTETTTDIYTPPNSKTQPVEDFDTGEDLAANITNKQKFVSAFTDALRPVTPAERLSIGEIGNHPSSDLIRWKLAIKECAINFTGRRVTVAIVEEVYNAGGTWTTRIAKLKEREAAQQAEQESIPTY